MALNLATAGSQLKSGMQSNNLAAAGIGAASGLIGMIGQKKREKRAMANQMSLMDKQQAGQEYLNRQEHELQYEMWKKTNYPAQVAMMEEAGINPATLYGNSGAGGTTTGSQGGGSAASGNAPAPQPILMGEAIKAALAASQIKLANSQAEKNEAEAGSIRGEEGTVGEATIKEKLANVLNTQSKTELNYIEREIGNATKGDRIDLAFYQVEEIAKKNNLTDEQTKLVKQEIVTEGVQRQLMRSNIEVNDQTIRKMVANIQQEWQKLGLEEIGLRIQNQGNKLRALEGKTDLQRLKQDWILGYIGKEIDLERLNIEQQKIFVSIFNGLLGSLPTSSL